MTSSIRSVSRFPSSKTTTLSFISSKNTCQNATGHAEQNVYQSRTEREDEPFGQILRDVQLRAHTYNFGIFKDFVMGDELVSEPVAEISGGAVLEKRTCPCINIPNSAR